MPDWLSVLLLGCLEGITEFLPVSSTGHLLIAEHWLGHRSDLFNVVIQSGAVVAVIVVFAQRVRDLLTGWARPEVRDYLYKLGLAFVITAVGGLILKKRGFELPETPHPVAWATLIGGIAFIVIERWLRNHPGSTEVTWRVAVAVGIGQLIAATCPGASRSGTTILLALMVGMNRSAAAEFTFLLGIPTLLAAGAKETLDVLKTPNATHEPWSLILLGTLVSAGTAFLAVKWLLGYIRHHTFVPFGWYRVILGGAILLWVR